jgi:hypothetical protein
MKGIRQGSEALLRLQREWLSSQTHSGASGLSRKQNGKQKNALKVQKMLHDCHPVSLSLPYGEASNLRGALDRK